MTTRVILPPHLFLHQEIVELLPRGHLLRGVLASLDQLRLDHLSSGTVPIFKAFNLVESTKIDQTGRYSFV